MARQNRYATISDVATHAGVSPATVSRVISGVGYVAQATRGAVERSVAELKFQPSVIAQSLRRQRSGVVALIVTDIQNPFYPELVRGVEDEVRLLGYSLVLCNSADDPAREVSYLEFLYSQRVGGIIVCADGFLGRNRDQLLSHKGHVVLVDVDVDDRDIPTVSSQTVQGGRLAGAHIAECGYGKIIYLASPLENEGDSPRFRGIVQGAGNVPVHYVSSEVSLEGGALAVQAIMQTFTPPFGLIAHNDLSAIGAMHAFIARGVQVPSEVGIVGYDDIAMSAYVTPSLTTVKQNQYRLGVEAMEILGSLLSGSDGVTSRNIPTELVIRSSTMKIL
jgi:LacI family transcriptional regulator